MAVDNIRGPQLSTWQRVALRTGFHRHTVEKLSGLPQSFGMTRSWFGYGAPIQGLYYGGVTAAPGVDSIAQPHAPLPILEQDKIDSANKTVYRYLATSHWIKWLRRGVSLVPVAGFAALAYLAPYGSAVSLFSSNLILGMGKTAFTVLNWGSNIFAGTVIGLAIHTLLRIITAGNPFSRTKHNAKELFNNNLEGLAYTFNNISSDKVIKKVRKLFTSSQIEVLNKLTEAIQYVEDYRAAKEDVKAIDAAKYNPTSVDKLITEVNEKIKDLSSTQKSLKVLEALEQMKSGMEEHLTDQGKKDITEILAHKFEKTEKGLLSATEDHDNLTEVKRKLENISQKTAEEQALLSQISQKLIELDQLIKALRKDLGLDELLTGINSHYQLGKAIGEGGMGAVFSASNTTTGELVAVKFLNLKKIMSQLSKIKDGYEKKKKAVSFILRFYNEFRNSLDHPNICKSRDSNIPQVFTAEQLENFQKLFRTGPDGKTPLLTETEQQLILDTFDLGAAQNTRFYIVTNFIPEKAGDTTQAKTITEYFTGRLLEQDFKSMFLPVIEALVFAHEKNIAHRDLKPSNLMVTIDKKPKVVIIDFGIAKDLDSELGLTGSGDIMGSKHYMPPLNYSVSAKDNPEIEKLGDIYSLGVILYELFSGNNPFRTMEDAERNASLTSPSLDYFDFNQVPTQWAPIIKKMLSPKYQDNFKSMKDVRRAFADPTINLDVSFDATMSAAGLPPLTAPLSNEQKVAEVIDYLNHQPVPEVKAMLDAITNGIIQTTDDKGNVVFEIVFASLNDKELITFTNGVTTLRANPQYKTDTEYKENVEFAKDFLEGEFKRR